MLDLNNNEEFGVKEFKVFNNGEAGVVEGCSFRVEKKNDDSNQPDYKIFIADDKGEVSEGFYYAQERNGKSAEENFKAYQGKRLVALAKGVLGNDYKFPQFNSPKEALDGVMTACAKASAGTFRAVVSYGTIARPEQYLRFQPWTKFIQNEIFQNELSLSKNALDKPVIPDEEKDPFSNMGGGSESTNDVAPW